MVVPRTQAEQIVGELQGPEGAVRIEVVRAARHTLLVQFLNGHVPPARSRFKVCVIGHLREEKDPLRTAMAARLLPSSSRLRVLHIGRALNPDFVSRFEGDPGDCAAG